jgi:hypothetical protein
MRVGLRRAEGASPCRKLPSVGTHWQIEHKGREAPGEAMRNITVTIPNDSNRRARVWAASRDTSAVAVSGM